MDTCTCALPQHKLIVDVHSQGGVTSVTSLASGGRCREHGKHTTDRVAAGAVRCHTDADRQLAVAANQHRNDQLDNCDRSGGVTLSGVMMRALHVPFCTVFFFS